jgi:hypothetical protein
MITTPRTVYAPAPVTTSRTALLALVVCAATACSGDDTAAPATTAPVVTDSTLASAAGPGGGDDELTITAVTEVPPGCSEPRLDLAADSVVAVARSYLAALTSADPAQAEPCLTPDLRGTPAAAMPTAVGRVLWSEAVNLSLTGDAGFVEARAHGEGDILQRALTVELVDGVALVTEAADQSPLWTAQEASTVATEYVDALGAGDLATAARLLGSGGADLVERADLTTLYATPPTDAPAPSGDLDARLEWWCDTVGADCSGAAEVVRTVRIPYGFDAIVRQESGRELRVEVSWYEGVLGVATLPERVFDEPQHDAVIESTPGLVAHWPDAADAESLGEFDAMTLNVWSALPAADPGARVLLSSPTFQLWMTPGGDVGYTPNWSGPIACDGYPYGGVGAAGVVVMLTLLIEGAGCTLLADAAVVQGTVARARARESLDDLVVGAGRDGASAWGTAVTDLAVWDRALSAVEIAALHDSA